VAIKPLEVSISDLVSAIEGASSSGNRQTFQAKLWEALDDLTLLEILEKLETSHKISSLWVFLFICRRKNAPFAKVNFMVALESLRGKGLIEDKAYYHLRRCVSLWRLEEEKPHNIGQFLKLAGGPEGEKKVLLGLRAVLRHLAPRS